MGAPEASQFAFQARPDTLNRTSSPRRPAMVLPWRQTAGVGSSGGWARRRWRLRSHRSTPVACIDPSPAHFKGKGWTSRGRRQRVRRSRLLPPREMRGFEHFLIADATKIDGNDFAACLMSHEG